MDPFCLKQFSGDATGQHITIPCKPDEFVRVTNEAFDKEGASALKDGYAPFCKHLFLPASAFPWRVPCCYAEISAENKAQLESAYVARTEKELPVLTRFFKKGTVTPADAEWYDVILYSRAQIEKEHAAMNAQASVSADSAPAASGPDALSAELNTESAPADSAWEWGIVSIKPQSVDYETPMNPITVMRNALGVDEGGSGIPLDRGAYLKSVEFWSKHALVQ